jgi:predicted nucleic acid-binding protein
VIILDTNVVSEPVRPHPERCVLDWLDGQDAEQVRITVITAAELRAGIALLPEGRRRAELGTRVEDLITRQFARRIASFGIDSTAHYAWIIARRRALGRPITVQDALIASIARAHHAVVATRNTTEIEECGIDLIKPWEVDR